MGPSRNRWQYLAKIEDDAYSCDIASHRFLVNCKRMPPSSTFQPTSSSSSSRDISSLPALFVLSSIGNWQPHMRVMKTLCCHTSLRAQHAALTQNVTRSTTGNSGGVAITTVETLWQEIPLRSAERSTCTRYTDEEHSVRRGSDHDTTYLFVFGLHVGAAFDQPIHVGCLAIGGRRNQLCVRFTVQ